MTVATGGEPVARFSAHCNDRFPVRVVLARSPPLQPDSASGLSDGGGAACLERAAFPAYRGVLSVASG